MSVPKYTLTDLGTLPGDSTSEAWGLNDRGDVVGDSWVSGFGARAFLYSAGKMIDLGAPGGSKSPGPSSFAFGINDSGQVVGKTLTPTHGNAFLYSDGVVHDLNIGGGDVAAYGINAGGQIVGTLDVGGYPHAMLYSGGSAHDLGTLGENSSGATAINAAGQVVGHTTDHPFLYTDGTMIDLGSLGGNNGVAQAINDKGQVVGRSATTNNGSIHAFLYSGGSMQDLGSLGGTSGATGINDSGVIVGDSSQGAFVYVNGTMYDLNPLIANGSGYFVEAAKAIDARGQIAANAIAPGGEQHAVLLTPTSVPLPPAAWAVLPVIPLLWLGGRRRRNRTRQAA